MNETWAELVAKSKGEWHTPAPERRAKASAQNQEVSADTRMADMDSTSDADIALIFATMHKQTLRYVPELKAWAFWDQKKARWVQDVAGDVAGQHRLKLWMWALAQDKANKAGRAVLAGGGTQAEAEAEAAGVEKALKSTGKLTAVWSQVRSEPCLITSLRHFDADPWVLNTARGPIDLWTGELCDPTPEVLCFKQTAVAPEEGAAPLWEKVLEDAFPGDPETQAYVETALSLALVGDQAIQHFWMLSGEAGSGKGTIMNTVMQMLGTGETGYATPVEATFLMRQKNDKHPEEVARLKGKRLVVANEADKKQVFDAARVKDLTGDDIKNARFMRGNSFSFKPTWKLFLMTNYRPRVDPEDGGFWRRFREIPFRHKPSDPIANLQTRLIEEEGPQILGRLLDRLTAFLDGGGMWTPEAIQNATLENKAEQDAVVEFIHEVCDVGTDSADALVTSASLFEEYVRWSRLNGYDSLTSNAFGRRVTALGFESATKRVNGKAVKVRLGLRLSQEASMY